MKYFSTLALCLLSTLSSAHNLFPAIEGDNYTLRLWADDHWETPKAEQVIGITAYDNNNNRLKVGYDYKNGKIAMTEKAAVMTAEYDFGYYTFTADQHFAKDRDQVDGFIYDSRQIYKIGKTVFSWYDQAKQPIGLKIEVTPQTNPLLLGEGDQLKVLVTLDGKPYSHAEFEDQVDDIDNVKIDANGIATITLRKPQEGWQIIGATAKLPYQLADKKAQTLQLTATLAFPSK